MAAQTTFRIDVSVNDLLVHSGSQPPTPPAPAGATLPAPVFPGDFHPITAYLFVEYKCNIDCWYCWSFNNKVKGMTEDVARRSIDWLHDHGCRVLALMAASPCCGPISRTK